MDPNAIADVIAKDEGLRLFAYDDLTGKPIVLMSGGKVTVGYGRNLNDVGISECEARELLLNDIQKVIRQLDNQMTWWRDCTPVRQSVLVNMAFNIGIAGLFGFRRMLTALQSRDYETAANEMTSSRWASQVGARAARLAQEMRTGVVA